MTETLSKGREYDPMLNYSHENYPPCEEQTEFFRYALLEGEQITKRPKCVRGPLYSGFEEVLQATDALIKRVNPRLTGESIMPWGYQSAEVRQRVQALDIEDRRTLLEIGDAKIAALQDIASDFLDESPIQPISEGALDVPFYTRQADDWVGGDTIRACTNACFRMIFGSIAGWVPSQKAISEQLTKRYGTAVVDDSVYSSIYQTEVFSEICSKGVVTVELIGADFNTIDKLATGFKRKYPEGEVYSMVNLASRTAGNTVWHSCVLLGTNDDGKVIYHDPSNQAGGAYKETSYNDFMRRWSVAYNRTVITLAS